MCIYIYIMFIIHTWYIYIYTIIIYYIYIYVHITIWGWPPWDHYTIPTQLGTPPFHPGLVSLFHCFSTVPFAGAVGAVLLLALGVPKRAKATVSKERIERSQAHIRRGAETMEETWEIHGKFQLIYDEQVMSLGNSNVSFGPMVEISN